LQQAENLLFEQAAAQGQSVFAAAGDNGSDDCNTDETASPVSGQNPVSVDDPGSQPYVVSVGGTTIDDAATKRPIEQVWNDGAVGGAGGGGISQSWAIPAWQRQSRVPGIALPGSAAYTDANKVEKKFGYPANFCLPTVLKQNLLPACRLVPDVSAQADEYTGAITIYQAASGGWGTIGGTSSATPIWAAVLALVNASPTCAPGQVTIMGASFTGATSVTFGGVKADSFTVDSRDEITATPPAYSRATACAPLPKTGVYAGENASNDICQVQVQVAGAHGVSATGRIRPPAQGAVVVNSLGVLVPPAGCRCETTQAPTEYDYVPTPTITSVSTSSPANFASEYGGTLITIGGKGLDPLTIDWADFGDPASEFSQDVSYVYLTGTQLQMESPQEGLTTGPLRVPLSIRTLAGQSKPATVTYAGIPDVTALINLASHRKLNGDYGAPDTGGTPVRVAGKGFAGQVIGPVYFADTGGGSFGSQYAYTINGNTSLRSHTVAQLPGRVFVEVCTATGCGRSQAGQIYLYAPGNPHVSSVSPGSGPARGGTKVTVSGDNLGCAIAVYFGNAAARKVKPVPTLTDCASTIAVKATSPAGKAGSKVPVSVETVESYFAGSGRGTTTARFTYK
jgi:hypothetical protein